MSKRIAAVLASLWVGNSVAMAQGLNLGDPAPRIEVQEFVKGAPVKALEKGGIYVVEFWATWCEPCRATIPHLTDLQKRYRDVRFVGVAAFEGDPADVGPFVKRMGDAMGYSVAIDAKADGDRGGQGTMARDWMEAAGEHGIPTAFIVDREARIAWIGPPGSMDEPLEQVVAGIHDLKAAIARRLAAKAREQKRKAYDRRLAKARQEGEKALLNAIDEVIADEPSLEKNLASMKFLALVGKAGDPGRAALYGRKLVEGIYANNVDALNLVAWAIVDPSAGKREEKLVRLALMAATRADELAGGKNPAVAETLAKVHLDSGDVAQAIEVQERAITLLAKDAAGADEAKERLVEYRGAARGRAAK